MKKMINRKLTLNRETLRALNPNEITGIAGGATDGLACTGGSTPSVTCDTCVGWSCRHGDC